MNILLLQPPIFSPAGIYLSVPSLTASLKAAGHEVRQFDLNIEFWCRLINKRNLENGSEILHDKIKELKKKTILSVDELFFLKEYGKLDSRREFIVSNTIKLFGENPIRLDMNVPNLLMNIGYAAKLSMVSYYPDILKFSRGSFSLQTIYSPQSSTELCDAAEDFNNSTIIKILGEFLDSIIKGEKIDFIGLSCPYDTNFIPAFQIISYLRSKLNTHICIGGAAINNKMRKINNPRIFNYIDSIIYDNGEKVICDLVNALYSEDVDWRNIPNLAYRYDNKIRFSEKKTFIFLDNYITPDFTGIDFSRYAAGKDKQQKTKQYLPVRLIHGCYWHKCVFCDINLPYVSAYGQRKVKEIVDELESFLKKYGLNNFHFVDEAAPPALIKKFSEMIIERGLDINWITNIRLEKYYSSEVCKIMKEAGCSMVFAGMESLNDRILLMMNKGIGAESAVNIVRNFSEAGIKVCTYLITGFPTQTLEEALTDGECIRLLMKSQIISFGTWHLFHITMNSGIYDNPEKFDIDYYIPNPELDLSDSIYEWHSLKGMSQKLSVNVCTFLNAYIQKWEKGQLLDVEINKELFEVYIKQTMNEEYTKFGQSISNFNSSIETYSQYCSRTENIKIDLESKMNFLN